MKPALSLLVTLLLCASLCGCVTVESVEKSYPVGWSAPVTGTRCALPVGVFASQPDAVVYEYPDNNPGSTDLGGALDLAFPASGETVTHIGIEPALSESYRITLYTLAGELLQPLEEQRLDAGSLDCKGGRVIRRTDSRHHSFSSNDEGSYQPLFTAAYVVGTFGLGGPISPRRLKLSAPSMTLLFNA